MKKILALTVLVLSMSAFAQEPPKEFNPDDTNLKSGRHEEENKTEGGTLATGHDSDCPSCKAAEGANSSNILSRQDQSPKAATEDSTTPATKSGKNLKGRK